ncbi:1-acyl-sn-glycerol-3-phosphate acyltransferase [bacterium]|nr:1-acyl-sn-glycerol-3-phosphate acyltransferase [bacterium]QQR56607.1 MAG: 1-acyl-sn-glycerol-3-phosphate acyltransferase [Candidatus Melainabacteria bacterium]
MKTFLAQKYNALVSAACLTTVPFFLRKNQLEVKASKECLKELERLKKSSAVILFNHSDRFDPLAVAELSRLAGEDFSYIASREQFDGFNGVQGWLMQRCGAYSVLRGDPEDKQSKEATIEFIIDSGRKLVEFPEGDVTGRDDVILPLKQDGIKNILAAQQRLIKKGDDAPVYLLPVAIYYEVQKDGVKAMEKCIYHLEKRLGILQSDLPIATRVQRIVASLIFNLERVYGKKAIGDRLDQRLLSICAQVATSIAKMNGLPANQICDLSNDTLEKVLSHSNPEHAAEEVMVYLHSVRNQLWRSLECDRKAIKHEGTENQANDYEVKLRSEILVRKQNLFQELDKLEQLLILAHSVQQEISTLNHAWRVIDRLEQEITGKTTLKGHRIAYIEAGPVLNLLQFMPAYRGSEDGAVTMVDESVRQKILAVLNRMKAKHAIA